MRFYTLGRFEVYPDRSPVPIIMMVRPEARALCKILVTFRDYQIDKQLLREWLWPTLSPASGLQMLTATTKELQAMLDLYAPGENERILIEDHGDSVRLDDKNIWVDTNLLFAGAQLDVSNPQSLEILEVADSLYRGPYLPQDWSAEWSREERDRAVDAYEKVLTKLIEAYMLHGDYHAAQSACETLAEFNPASLEARLYHMRCAMALGGDEPLERAA